MPVSASAILRIVVLASIAATIGCKRFNMPTIPVIEKLMPNDPVPPEVAARYGPPSTDRLRQIRRQGDAARSASAQERQRISQELAQRIEHEDDPVVRQNIVRAIAQCRTAMAYNVLTRALNDEDIDVQIESCRAWGEWGTTDSVQILGQIIRNDRADLDVKLAAVAAMANVKQQGAVTALAPALDKSQNPALQHRAVMSLKKLSSNDFGNDLEAWRNFAGGAKPAAYAASPTTGEVPQSTSLTDRALFWRR